MAVRLCAFACDTARGVRFGQCRESILQFVLPVGRESGSTGGQFCNLYCLRCANRAVQKEILLVALPLKWDSGSRGEENASSTA